MNRAKSAEEGRAGVFRARIGMASISRPPKSRFFKEQSENDTKIVLIIVIRMIFRVKRHPEALEAEPSAAADVRDEALGKSIKRTPGMDCGIQCIPGAVFVCLPYSFSQSIM